MVPEIADDTRCLNINDKEALRCELSPVLPEAGSSALRLFASAATFKMLFNFPAIALALSVTPFAAHAIPIPVHAALKQVWQNRHQSL